MDLKRYFNSGSKKQELSSNSSTVHDFTNLDVFTELLYSPDCVAVLYNCIGNIEKQIKDIFSKTEETKNSQIKGEQHLMNLNKTVTFISGKFDSLNVTEPRKKKTLINCRKTFRVCL